MVFLWNRSEKSRSDKPDGFALWNVSSLAHVSFLRKNLSYFTTKYKIAELKIHCDTSYNYCITFSKACIVSCCLRVMTSCMLVMSCRDICGKNTELLIAKYATCICTCFELRKTAVTTEFWTLADAHMSRNLAGSLNQQLKNQIYMVL
jgi:hypothetical protein